MKVAVIVLAIVGVVVSGFIYTHDPAQGYGLPACSFKVMTGYHCPGCGGTRSVHALLHGRLGEAIHYNPLLIVALVTAAAVIGWTRMRRKPGRNGIRMSTRQGVALALAIIGAILGFGVVRNQSWYPGLRPPVLEHRADHR